MAKAAGQFGLDVSRALGQYADMIRRICFLYLKRKEDVEDVFQDVFVKYMQRSQPFDNEEHEKAWLLRVAINSCKDLLGSFWHNRVLPLDDDLVAVVPAESQPILDAVLSLPARERTAIYLFYYEGYSVPEIARIQNTNVNTIYSHLYRARKRLGKQIGGG
jgi:RNA polymerase sigma factor (sigma-70 family)